MNDEKQAVLSAIQKINAVEGFDPTPLAVEYVDLNTQEKRLRLPVMAQLAWFRLKYPEGRVYHGCHALAQCGSGSAILPQPGDGSNPNVKRHHQPGKRHVRHQN